MIREAIARSLNDIVPAGNALPMDATLAWSRQDWEGEAEQQRRLLDLTAARRHATPAPLIKLEDSSDDEWYQPTSSPPHLGDLGQGSRRRGALGQSSSQQALPEDDGDYTAFYCHFGM
jgi:hypothetical protein